MNARQVAPLLLASLVSLVSAQNKQTPAEVIRQVAKCMQETEELERRMRLNVGKARQARDEAADRLKVLRESHNPDVLDRRKRRLGQAESAVAYTRLRLSAARLEAPETRAAQLKKANADVLAARAALQAARIGPTEERAKLATEKLLLERELRNLGEKATRVPNDLGIAKRLVEGNVASGLATVSWLDVGKEQLARLQLQFGKPRRSEHNEADLLGRYPAWQLLEHELAFRVGAMDLLFTVVEPEWRTKRDLRKLLLRLLDADALESLHLGKQGMGELAQRTAEWRRRTRALPDRSGEAIAAADLQVSKAQARAVELGEPYSLDRVAKMERRLVGHEDFLLVMRAYVSTIGEAPAEHAAKLKQAIADHKRAKLAHMEESGPLMAEQFALRKRQRHADLALTELIEGTVLTPGDIGAFQAIVRASAGKGHADITWRDVYHKRLASAQMHIEGLPFRIPPGPGRAARKQVVHAEGNGAASLVAGGVRMRLAVKKAEWRDKKAVLELVPKLLDLAAITAWPMIEDVE